MQTYGVESKLKAVCMERYCGRGLVLRKGALSVGNLLNHPLHEIVVLLYVHGRSTKKTTVVDFITDIARIEKIYLDHTTDNRGALIHENVNEWIFVCRPTLPTDWGRLYKHVKTEHYGYLCACMWPTLGRIQVGVRSL